MRWNNNDVLVVNDVGEYLFLTSDEFSDLVQHRLEPQSTAYLDLRGKHFLAEAVSPGTIELLATKYRTKKDFLTGFTSLHMFVVTLRCDHSCRYCQVSRVSADRRQFDMTRETASRAIDLMFRSPSSTLKVEFQGGEPLLNFDLIRHIVAETEAKNCEANRRIEFVVATNMVNLDSEMLEFCRAHEIQLSTSIDGPQDLHNANRLSVSEDSYQRVIGKLQWAREVLGPGRISALMTTTERSLKQPQEIVRTYQQLGFEAIFLRPISPYGFALRTKEAYQYQAREFVDFYKKALEEVITLNREGFGLVEVYAQLLLRKMLTPFATKYVDLQSPAGAGIGCVVYNYDGSVFASDESRMLAEMGDATFRLGNVHTDSYQQIFGGEVARALVNGSVLEALPGCAECSFLPYCGADPVRNHATQGDIIGHRPSSAFCTHNMGIIRHLFDLVRGPDPFVRDLLGRWATGCPSRIASRTYWA
jgi:His-Xaa-Ser system radical SAM maturase HxsB